MHTHSGTLCRAALIKSRASGLRCAATVLLQDTRPSSTFKRVARSLSPANGDTQVKLKAQCQALRHDPGSLGPMGWVGGALTGMVS